MFSLYILLYTISLTFKWFQSQLTISYLGFLKETEHIGVTAKVKQFGNNVRVNVEVVWT